MEHGHGEKAVRCYENMQLQGIFPEAATLMHSLKACGSVGAIREGHEIHVHQTGYGKELYCWQCSRGHEQ